MARTTSPEPPPPLSLGPGAVAVRRTLGPIAWAVLECLAATAVERDGKTVSDESVRGIAGTLGLAKDTAARALRRLAAGRLVTYVPSRGAGGRFGTSHYRLTLPADLFTSIQIQPTTPPRATPTPSAHHPHPTQLSLIDNLSTDR